MSVEGLVVLKFSKAMEYPEEWYSLAEEGRNQVEKIVNSDGDEERRILMAAWGEIENGD